MPRSATSVPGGLDAWPPVWSSYLPGVRTPRDTDWFHDARYGVFMHLLPADAKGLASVPAGSTCRPRPALDAMGAGYFVITLGQNSGYFNAPNAAYDRSPATHPANAARRATCRWTCTTR